MMKHFLNHYIILFHAICSISFAVADTPVTFENVKIGVEKHFEQYDQCEFTYDVQRKNPQGVMQERRNTYKIHFLKSGYPVQSLIEEKLQDGKYSIESFMAFDGKQTCFFRGGELLKGKWGQARIVATHSPENFLDDSFARLLTTSIVGMPFTIMDSHQYEHLWNEQRDQFKFVAQQIVDGYKVLVFKKTIKGNDYEVKVLEPPNCMIVGLKAVKLSNKEVFQNIVVQEIGKIGELVYPKKGHVYQKIALTSSDTDKFCGVDYSFNVTNVNILKNYSIDTWCPKYPPGTSVTNDITGETIKIPFTDEQKEMIIAHAEKHLPDVQSPLTSYPIRVFIIILGLAMISVAIYERIRRKKSD